MSPALRTWAAALRMAGSWAEPDDGVSNEDLLRTLRRYVRAAMLRHVLDAWHTEASRSFAAALELEQRRFKRARVKAHVRWNDAMRRMS